MLHTFRRPRLETFLVWSILLISLVIRLWRINTDLLFHYDQGRDLLAAYKIWHERHPVLLGPSTDTPGVFVGPFYYYLISIPLIITQGSPVGAIVFLQILEIISLYFLYVAIKNLFGARIAFPTLLLTSVSYGLISYSRWLSNATPVFSLGNFAFFAFSKIISDKFKLLPLYFFIVGLMWQADPAVGFGFLPFGLYLIFKSPGHKLGNLIINLIFFLVPALPQIIFEYRHDFLVSRNLFRFLTNPQEGVGFSQATFIQTSTRFFNFISFIFAHRYLHLSAFLFLLSLLGIFKSKISRSPNLKGTLLLASSHVLGLFAFKRGVFEFFYLGVAGPLITLVVYGLYKLSPRISVIILVIIIVYNLYLAKNFLSPNLNLTPIGTANLITLESRLKTLEFIDTNKPYSLWTYTIPYFLDEPWKYLMLWKNYSPPVERGDNLYAIYEPDWNQPIRLTSWHENANRVSTIIDVKSYGDLTIEKRQWENIK